MLKMRSTLRYASIFVATFFIIPLGGEFVIELAKEYGWLSEPSKKVAATMDRLSFLANNWLFQILAASAASFSIGVWLDFFLKKKVDEESIAIRKNVLLNLYNTANELAKELVNFAASRRRGIATDVLSQNVDPGALQRFYYLAGQADSGFFDEYNRRFFLPVREVVATAHELGLVADEDVFRAEHPTTSGNIDDISLCLHDVAIKAKTQLALLGEPID